MQAHKHIITEIYATQTKQIKRLHSAPTYYVPRLYVFTHITEHAVYYQV